MRPDMMRCSKSRATTPLVSASEPMARVSIQSRHFRMRLSSNSRRNCTWQNKDFSAGCLMKVAMTAANTDLASRYKAVGMKPTLRRRCRAR
eukprot:11053068-Lingulodinium_polyedra.AAC.1